MKKIGNLYDKIFSKENLERSMFDACKTKRNHKQVVRVLNRMNDAIIEIQNNPHISARYIIKNHVDISSGKERQLTVPPYYPDQIIQHALIRVTEPYVMKKIMPECCCSIKGRGMQYASNLIRKDLQKHKNARYFVKFDVKKYFPHINHEVLMNQLSRIFKDKRVLALYKEIIDSVEEGIPIGNYTSQLLANLYLTDLDRYIKQELHIKYYARYMDDFIIIGSNKRYLNKCIKLIKKFLKDNLKLETHNDEKVLDVYQTPIDFCGFRHYKDHTTIRKKIWVRARRMLLRLQDTLKYKQAKRLMSYLGYIFHSDSFNILERFHDTIRRAKYIMTKKYKIQKMKLKLAKGED